VTSARISRLAKMAAGEALLYPAGSEIKRLLISAFDALDEAARIAEERESWERGADPRGDSISLEGLDRA
jgi:hypothetical protein